MKLLLGYYEKNPKRDIKHPEIVDWATKEWKKKKGVNFRDPDRGIRKLHQNGYLIKVSKGVYRYDPDFIKTRSLEDFDPKTKAEILKRDGYKCVICGRGLKEGMELHADHIKAKDYAGQATLENGQTLCGQHNYLKKNFGQTTLGKKYFINLLKVARASQDNKFINFCEEVLKLFSKYELDTHITD